MAVALTVTLQKYHVQGDDYVSILNLRRGAFLLPLASLLLSACATLPSQGPGKSPDSPQWKQHVNEVKQVQAFQTRGAFAYISQRQNVYARYNWQQSASDRYRLILTNPLGSTEMQLDTQGQTVQLVDNNGKRYTSNNASKMISELTGMNIPLENLRQWMLGLPGTADSFTLNDHYQLRTATYQQDGQTWHVTINDYKQDVTPALPADLELTAGDLKIKLRMDSWKLQ
ncbi:outer membrane lipoprotein [Tatumella ptyseos ATCC 33301]|uniref:Outer-membrane lipoprotein LolB n=2 Tax=Tatumella ptyseos TaxID=82987 RepID=A0A085JDX1_9GAMM|nr:lipoprotein insertase outer membrane protein LolB [Tatumella ptyseos]KFD18667.1 outer membrane lipoprotein [Tatumella ptyseos ATCC 33301]SQK74610.1 Outer-membrane lipoprotein lolB precursor [Tatumella ptyseos]